MKQQRAWAQRLRGYLDMDTEALPLQTVLELCGDRRLLIENHTGVREYGPEKICVRVRYGVVSVCGEGLRLCRMQSQQLVIMGRIDSIAVIRGRK